MLKRFMRKDDMGKRKKSINPIQVGWPLGVKEMTWKNNVKKTNSKNITTYIKINSITQTRRDM
jgi:hypothetical protein